MGFSRDEKLLFPHLGEMEAFYNKKEDIEKFLEGSKDVKNWSGSLTKIWKLGAREFAKYVLGVTDGFKTPSEKELNELWFSGE